MLSGWVANTSTASDATKYPNYVEIDGEYDEKDLGEFIAAIEEEIQNKVNRKVEVTE